MVKLTPQNSHLLHFGLAPSFKKGGRKSAVWWGYLKHRPSRKDATPGRSNIANQPKYGLLREALIDELRLCQNFTFLGIGMQCFIIRLFGAAVALGGENENRWGSSSEDRRYFYGREPLAAFSL